MGGSLDSNTNFNVVTGTEINYLASDLEVISGILEEPRLKPLESMLGDLAIVSGKLNIPYPTSDYMNGDLAILAGKLQVEPTYDLDESLNADLSIDGGELS